MKKLAFLFSFALCLLLAATSIVSAGGQNRDPQLNISHIKCVDDKVEVHFVLLHSEDKPSDLVYDYGLISPGGNTGNVWHFTDYLSPGYININFAYVYIGTELVNAHNPRVYSGYYVCTEPTSSATPPEKPTSPPTATATPTVKPTVTKTPTQVVTEEPDPSFDWHWLAVCDFEPNEVEIRVHNTGKVNLRIEGEIYAKPDDGTPVQISAVPGPYQTITPGNWGGPEERIENWFDHFSGIVYGEARVYHNGTLLAKLVLPKTRLECGQKPTQTPEITPTQEPTTTPTMTPTNEPPRPTHCIAYGALEAAYTSASDIHVYHKDGYTEFVGIWGHHQGQTVQVFDANNKVIGELTFANDVSVEGPENRCAFLPSEEPVEEKPVCPDCPPAECLLRPGNYVAVANQWVGLDDNSVPHVFETEAEAVEMGLTYAGYECGLCAEYLVRDGQIFITTGSTAYDMAVAINLSEGSPAPYFLNRHMTQAQGALLQYSNGYASGWYDINQQ